MGNKKLSTNTVVCQHPNILVQSIDADIVLFNPNTSEYFGLQETGKRIWECIENPVSVGSVVETLVTEYEVERKIIEEQTTLFIETLAGKDLITIVNQ